MNTLPKIPNADTRESRQARRHRERREAKPSVHLLTDRQARGLIRSLVRSRQWWVFPVMNEAGVALAEEIEQRHYLGEANRDYLVILGPLPTIFARKSRMPAAALAKVMMAFGPLPEWNEAQWCAALAEQDILVGLSHEDDAAETRARLMAWHDWLVGEEATA